MRQSKRVWWLIREDGKAGEREGGKARYVWSALFPLDGIGIFRFIGILDKSGLGKREMPPTYRGRDAPPTGWKPLPHISGQGGPSHRLDAPPTHIGAGMPLPRLS